MNMGKKSNDETKKKVMKLREHARGNVAGGKIIKRDEMVKDGFGQDWVRTYYDVVGDRSGKVIESFDFFMDAARYVEHHRDVVRDT